MKAVNQLLAGIHICATAEATAFARHKGMDLEAVYEVVSKGAASSYCMKDRTSTAFLTIAQEKRNVGPV